MRSFLLLVLLASCSHYKHGVVFWEEQCPEGTRHRTADDGRRRGQREWCEIPRGRIDGVLHGRWLRSWPDGTPRRAGQYKNGKQVGVWTSYYADGGRMQTTQWQKDEESGEQQRWHANGKTMWRGWIRHGRRQGHWAGFFESGDNAWVGEFKEGRPYGEWTFFDADGEVTRKQSFGDLMPAAWWRRPRPCPEGAQLHGAPPPRGRAVQCRTRTTSAMTWTPHGPSAELFVDGSAKVTGAHADGDKHGRWITWREDGSPRLLETWDRGVLDGPRLEWDRDGVLVSATRYRAGSVDKRWTRPWCPRGGRDDQGEWWTCE